MYLQYRHSIPHFVVWFLSWVHICSLTSYLSSVPSYVTSPSNQHTGLLKLLIKHNIYAVKERKNYGDVYTS
jgi:hypothetical protein